VTLTAEPPVKTRATRRPAQAPPPPAATPAQPNVKIGNLHINVQSSSSHSSDMKSDVVTITPQMATEMLERSHDNGALNRSVKQSRVERYASDMRAGNWRLTGESIKLDCNGNVRDGQNRLFACIEAQTPFTTFVTINVPDNAFDVMDSGAPRTASDVMFIHSYENPTKIAAAVRYAIIWERKGRPDNNTYVSKADLLKWIERNQRFVEFVTLSRKIARAGIPGGDAIWATTLWVLADVDLDETYKFAESVTSGAGLTSDSGVLMLRNLLIRAKGTGKKLTVTEVAALIIKAWNAWRNGEKVRMLAWRQGGSSPEAFPKPR
jgi:hypothetical protein